MANMRQTVRNAINYGGGQLKKCCSYETLKKCLPILQWLPEYSFQWLQLDFIAGLTVGLTVVPQSLAYADVAGLPVQYGLYSSFMGCFVYCLLGTSKDVTLGPTAIMSLLVYYYAFQDPVYAVLLTFLSGCIQLAMGILQLGFLVDFISYPVIKGFTSAAALTIGFGQVKNILGLHGIPQEFFQQIYYTFKYISETSVGDVTLGLVCILLLLLLSMMKKHPPKSQQEVPLFIRLCNTVVAFSATARNALIVVSAGLVAYSFEITGFQPFDLTGRTAEGLPSFQLPKFSEIVSNTTVTFSDIVAEIGPGLAVIPLMGLLESIAIAKAFGSKNDYRIDPNQELLAIGLTNFLGSFVSSYPVTGSFGRTAVNSQTGVCTPAGGLVTGIIVLLSLAFLTPLFFYIPKAALAAVIICAVAPMFDLKIALTLWKVKKVDLLPFFATFFLCLWEIQYGILVGIGVSGIILLYNVARPKAKVSVFEHGTLVVHLQSGLNFPAVEHVSHLIYENALGVSSPRNVVLDCTHVCYIDYTVLNGLRDLLFKFHRKGVSLVFSNVQREILKVLLTAQLDEFQYWDNVDEAVLNLAGRTCIEEMDGALKTACTMNDQNADTPGTANTHLLISEHGIK
ncbi:sodium-independent sulfate anion transporter [Protopterus annectens]|uniref:sodium-independent sulfate anion transporter n=1 Tax=Protopterus annectens TaxID=7888 RepID=UPI001CF93F3B|nr:sodium-independent sulfate anion transporter [Protopterus annectens]XP_043924014.1 sodium-independent sulfate anion transporter [Protopterus annectens]XP_043924015.1 sodium-independent sulfate anion transporter [Protopterus annectens]